MPIITVDTTSDVVDADDGVLSLREALAQADRTEAADTILFSDAVQGGTIVLAGSQLTVASEVTIDGGSGVTLDADERSRVLLVRSGTEGDPNEVTLAHLTVTGGKPTEETRSGGGIYGGWHTSMTLTDCTVRGNSMTGDFLRGGGIGSFGAVTLTDSTVSGNSTSGQWAEGGGIWSSDSVTLTNSTVSANSAAGDLSGGGGISAGSVRLVDSLVSDNSGGGIDAGSVFLADTAVERNRGGGIGASDVVAENSRIADNQSDGPGGGIRGSSITLTDSEVVGNTTTGDYAAGGGLFLSDAFGGGAILTLTRSVVGENSTDGDNSYGGGIACETYSYSTIRLYDSVVRSNRTSGEHAYGGGIASTFYSDVTAVNSTIYDNVTTGDYAHGGGIKGSVTLTNSTVSGNVTTGEHAGGGGIAGGAVLTNTTVTGNRTIGGSADGGGIGGGYAGGGYARVVNSIVAGNSTAHGSSPDVHGSTYSNGANVFGSEVEGGAPSDRQDIAPELIFARLDPETGGGQLAENGGPTPTIALRDASDNPALGRADPETAPETDQRGAARPQPGATNPDIGAFELDQSDPAPPPIARTFVVTSAGDVTADDGQLTLREALALADADNLTADQIEFSASVQGQTITLSGTQLSAHSDVTIDGGAGVTVDANQASRVLLVQGLGTDVALSHLTITGGRTTADFEGGGGIQAGRSTTLTLEDSIVANNTTSGFGAEGGGISGDDVTLRDSTVRDNHTAGEWAHGGGIFASNLVLTDAAVSDNRTSGDGAEGGGIIGETIRLTRSLVSGNSTQGNGANGGGVSLAAGGSLTLDASTIHSNTVRSSSGGGIYSQFSEYTPASTITLIGSTVSDNEASGTYGVGGGIVVGEYGELSLTNSTVSGNRAVSAGGIEGYSARIVMLVNSTVTGNSASHPYSSGGGVVGSGDGNVALVNSIVAGNSVAGNYAPDVSGWVVSNGSNILGSAVVGAAPSDQQNVAAEQIFAALDPETGGGLLADNGGPTRTIALRDAADNPALGRANAEDAPASDQRGRDRPQPDGTAPDIGSYELDQSDPGPPPVATTYVVTTTSDVTADDGQLTLREALALANADGLTADRIEFAASVQGQTIALAGTQLTVSSDVTIDGGAGVTLDAAQASRVLLVQGSGTDAVLRHLTITGGHVEVSYDQNRLVDYGGGGVFVGDYATATLDHTTVSGNSASGDQSRGGGIAGWSIVLNGSTVANNSAEEGGGIAGRSIAVSGSTVANNSGYRGGGIYGENVSLANSTVSGNVVEGDTGGVIGQISLLIDNNIISGNFGRFHRSEDVGRSITSSNGHNIFGSDVEGNAPGDLENVPAVQLFAAIDPTSGGGLLGENGGPTQTIALRDAPDNPALGGADPAGGPATDQRGEARPQPADSDPDIGAFELDQSDFTSPPPGTTYLVTSAGDVTADDGQLTLREALALADADALTPDRIEFAAAVQGQTIALGGSQLTVGSDVTIDGGAGVIIDAGGQSRVLQVQGFGTDVVLQHLTITGGHTAADGEGGGGVRADRYTTLTLDHTAVTNNSTAGHGSLGGGVSGSLVTLTNSAISGNSTTGEQAAGGGIWSFDSLTLTDSTVGGNSTTGDSAQGGGIAANGYATVTLTNSTVSDNATTGYSAGGGGIWGDSVSLTNSTISRNSALGTHASGGGIRGDVTLISSTVSDNKADGSGGGIAGGDVELINSTISGNSAIGQHGSGGGISGFDVTVTSSTISGNSASGANGHGGGVAAYGVLSVANSIIAGNRSDYHEPDVAGTIAASNGHNIFGSDVAGIFQDDLENVTPSLLFATIDPTTGGGLLADNGGPTLTIALRDDPTNPALGGSDPAGVPETDQRGVARPSPAGTDPDIGAFEHEWLSLVPAKPFDGLEYIASYPDLARTLGPDEAAGEVHYRTYGVFEGREVSFDGLEYIASHADLTQHLGADRDAGATHFIQHGYDEGRTTSFDGLEYIASYDDLITALGADRDAGSTHCIDHGAAEGRQTSFDGLQYIASHDDLIRALGPNADAGAVHYIRFGADEERGADDFDAEQYLANYADLQAAFGSDTEAATVHYIRYGHGEGRKDEPVTAPAAEDFLF